MKLTRTFLYFFLVLLTLYLVQWWLLFYYLTDVPEYIPNTDIKISGLLLMVTILPTFYFYLKTILKQQPSVSVVMLAMAGTLLAFTTEVLFQAVRQSVATTSFAAKLTESMRAVLLTTVILAIISFMISYKLKHKNSVWNTVILIAFFAAVYLIKTYTFLLK